MKSRLRKQLNGLFLCMLSFSYHVAIELPAIESNHFNFSVRKETLDAGAKGAIAGERARIDLIRTK